MNKLKKITDYPFLIFFLFVLMAYLPVFLPLFHLKNDLITQNLPTRYFISESLHSNYFPWWNPYIHFGIPQYGDMNNGFWNPFLWLIAKVFGYNIYTITLEEMFYILIGGYGIFKLLQELNIKIAIAILIAFSYMSCGYIVGHLQHFCWITGTGFFPFTCLYFLKANRAPTLKNFILSALSVFFFVSSTHPGLVIGAIYFFLFCLVFIFLFRKTYCSNYYHPKFWLINFILLLSSGLFSIVVLFSNFNTLQYISRGSKVSLGESLLDPTSLQSYISLLFPLSVNKSSFFNTDISMRNMYTGLTIAVVFIFSLKYIHKKVLTVISIPLIFFILLSSGGIFKTFFYYTLPLIGYVRLNGEFSYFVLLIFLLLTAFTLQLFVEDKKFKPRLKKTVLFLQIFFFIALIIVSVSILNQNFSFLHQKISATNFRYTLKNILDNISFRELLFINILVQLLTLFFLSKNYSHTKASLLLAGNLIITTWLILPFTGLGMESKKSINKKISTLPHGLYAQELIPLNKIKFLDTSLRNELRLLGSYSKKIGDPIEESYPVQLTTTKKFFEDTALHNFINQQAFIFLTTDTLTNAKTNSDSSNINISKFGAGHLKLTVNNSDYNFLIFLQNDYPYWEAFVNGKREKHFTVYKTFIGLPLTKGKYEIEYKFNPLPVRRAMWINIAAMVIGIIILSTPLIRNKALFKLAQQ